jgi:hypothetical protein
MSSASKSSFRQKFRFNHRVDEMGFVVHKLALGQVFLQGLWSFPGQSLFHQRTVLICQKRLIQKANCEARYLGAHHHLLLEWSPDPLQALHEAFFPFNRSCDNIYTHKISVKTTFIFYYLLFILFSYFVYFLVHLSISTCFGQLCAHHQEKELCLCDTSSFRQGPGYMPQMHLSL